jgi:Mycothiol maleylpyruvate isomerase N-terminal domain
VSIEAFVSATDGIRPLIAAAEVGAAWEEPSVLADLTVGALTAHLVSAVAGIDPFLDLPVPKDVEIAELGSYYSGEPYPASLRDALHARVIEASRTGPAAVLARFDEVWSRLRSRLAVESPDRLIRIPSRQSPTGEGPGGRYMRLGDFLVTRLVEVVVHTDDLAASVTLSTPVFSSEVSDKAISFFVDTCRRRHGDAAVIRAFTRRERDSVQALRVL